MARRTRISSRLVSRALMTVDAVGGVWTYALDLARELGHRGVRVTLALMGPPASQGQRGAVAALSKVDMFEGPFSLEWMDEPWKDVERAGEWLLDLERQAAPDIVHLNGFCHAALPWRSPALVVGHSCVLSWWRAVHGTQPPAAWDRYATEVARGIRAANLVVAPTSAMLAVLDFHYGPLSRTCVIPNGRSRPPVATRAKSREPLVLTAGRLWDQAKNVAAVCAAAPHLQWPVCVAGESRRPGGPSVDCCGVDRLGQLTSDELASWMARASIFALPARYEPFGLSIVEAAVAGCALVLGDIDSLREVWSDAAMYVPPDDVHALVTAIETLIDDAELRQHMARLAHVRATALTPYRMATAYLDAYCELIVGWNQSS